MWLAETDRQFDCIITDPPYDSLLKWQGVGTTARMGFGKGQDATESDKFFETIDADDMFECIIQFQRVLKNNAHCYVMCDSEYVAKVLGWVRESDNFSWRYSKALIWDKLAPGLGYHWRGQHEYIVMLEKGKRRLNDLGKSDVLRHKKVAGGYPTEKPYGLVEELVLNSTNENDWVLDPFCGSGVVGLVCRNHNRNCVLIDKSEKAISTTKEKLDAGLFN